LRLNTALHRSGRRDAGGLPNSAHPAQQKTW
jgi:hypothetical protein